MAFLQRGGLALLLKGYGVLGEEGGPSFPVTHVKKWPFFGHRPYHDLCGL